jgi:hypothetical protein
MPFVGDCCWLNSASFIHKHRHRAAHKTATAQYVRYEKCVLRIVTPCLRGLACGGIYMFYHHEPFLRISDHSTSPLTTQACSAMYGKCARLSKTVVRCIETLGMQLTVLDYRRGHIFQIAPGGFRVEPKHLHPPSEPTIYRKPCS